MKKILMLLMVAVVLKPSVVFSARFRALDFEVGPLLAFTQLFDRYSGSGSLTYTPSWTGWIPNLDIAGEVGATGVKGRDGGLLWIGSFRLGPRLTLFSISERVYLTPTAGIAYLHSNAENSLEMELAAAMGYRLQKPLLAIVDHCFLRYRAVFAANLTHLVEAGLGLSF